MLILNLILYEEIFRTYRQNDVHYKHDDISRHPTKMTEKLCGNRCLLVEEIL